MSFNIRNTARPVEPAGVRYTRRARLTGATEPITDPVVDWAAELLGPALPPETSTSALPRARHRRARKRSGVIGRRGVAVLAVCLMLAVSVVTAVMPSQPGTAASDGSRVGAIGTIDAGQSLSEVTLDSPFATALGTYPGRVGLPIAGSAFLAYTVKAGDTLVRIANSFDLSVTTLYWANQSTVPDPQLVKIGQELLIPPMDGLVLVASAGDTLQSIADKYGISTQVIVDANNLADPKVTAGQLLIVPGAETGPLPTPKIPVATPRTPNWLNKLTWPVPGHGRITLRFGCTGWAGEPRFGSCAHYHNGLDIGAPYSTPVVAAAAGTVIYAGWKKAGTDGSAGGILVWISHGGTLYTTYNHMSAVTVKAGQRVTAGQQIGKIGSTGASSGAHLHFEVWVSYPWTGKDVSSSRDPLLYTTYKP